MYADRSLPSLRTLDGYEIHHIEKNYKMYLDKMTLIYGDSGTGKTTTVHEYIDILNPHIPTFFLISPTNSATGAFDGIIAPKCIKTGIDKKETIKFLTTLISTQRDRCDIYKKANNFDLLKSVCSVYPSDKINRKHDLVFNLVDVEIKKLDPADPRFEQKKEELRNSAQKRMVEIYKKYIQITKKKINMDKLSDDEKVAVEFIDFNPRIGLIFDDCASRLREWMKASSVINQLFFEVRNLLMTCCIITQDDKVILSEHRRNAMISIFTGEQIATLNFTRASNGYRKPTAELAKKCIETVFKQVPGEPKNYKKLVYIKDTPTPFMYVLPNVLPKKKSGSLYIHVLSEKIEKEVNPPAKNHVLEKRMK